MNRGRQATTAAAIKSAKPESRPYKMGAGLGMYLLVNPGGSKLWRLKYRIGGKEKTLSLGAYPEVSLASARTQRDQARELLAQNIDPMEFAKEKKKKERIRRLTFAEVAERWYRNNAKEAAKPWAKSTARKVRIYLNKDILPALGSRNIAEITRGDLIELNQSIEDRGAFDVASKVRGWLAEIFDDAYDKEEIPNNPALRLRPSAKAKGIVSKHYSTVTFKELPALLEAVDATSSSLMNKLAIRVLLLTAVRPGELRLAQWSEFDFSRQIWTIPAERMKTRKEHTVPLSRQVVGVLQELKALAGWSKYVLPNSKGVPISDATINKTFRLAGYGGRQTGHGFRHLLSTELNERGYNSDWIEAQLAHKVGGEDTIRSVYNHAVYLKQRAEIMQHWADSIDAIISGANIVGFKHKEVNAKL